MYTCQPNNVSRVKVNVYIQFSVYICYFYQLSLNFV